MSSCRKSSNKHFDRRQQQAQSNALKDWLLTATATVCKVDSNDSDNQPQHIKISAHALPIAFPGGGARSHTFSTNKNDPAIHTSRKRMLAEAETKNLDVSATIQHQQQPSTSAAWKQQLPSSHLLEEDEMPDENANNRLICRVGHQLRPAKIYEESNCHQSADFVSSRVREKYRRDQITIVNIRNRIHLGKVKTINSCLPVPYDEFYYDKHFKYIKTLESAPESLSINETSTRTVTEQYPEEMEDQRRAIALQRLNKLAFVHERAVGAITCCLILSSDQQQEQKQENNSPAIATSCFTSSNNVSISTTATTNDEEILYIATMAVYPALRRRGIGSLLLKEAIKEAINRGISIVQLHVQASNNESDGGPRAFYERFGFRMIDTVKDFYKHILWGSPDAILYQLDLRHEVTELF